MLRGYYNNLGYRIEDEEGNELYTAGNSPHDSQVYVSADAGVGLERIKEFCETTLKEMAEEQGTTWEIEEEEGEPAKCTFVPSESGIEVSLLKECIEECTHAGVCDAEVEKWVQQSREELDLLDKELVAKCLKGYGAWSDEELQDHEQNLKRLLWVAAGNCKEEDEFTTYIDAI